MTPRHSPFKFLDSYQKDDLDIFFGREKETEKLYDALSGVKHLLVYGPSGAGKTSLIECGLRNQFSDADWLAITVRRSGDLNAAVFARIRQQLREPFALDPATKLPAEAGFEFGDAVERLFAEQFKPVYLLFDQFEELLIQGSDAEKEAFFTRLQQLIRYKVPCRVLLVYQSGSNPMQQPPYPIRRMRMEKRPNRLHRYTVTASSDSSKVEKYKPR